MAAKPGVSRCTARSPSLANASAEAVEIAAAGSSQQNDARQRGREEEYDRPQPADHQGDQDEGTELRRRQRHKADKSPFNQGHRCDSRADLVGATIWIVYGPAGATTGAGRSLWISPVACLDITAGTGVCFADLFLQGFPPIPRFRRHDGSRACETCSISTPSYSWRWRCSSSCACGACSASVRAESGRPMTPIRRATRCAARPTTTSSPARPRRRDRAKADRDSRAGRALEGDRRSRLDDRRRPRRDRPRGSELRRPAFRRRRARRLRDDRDGLCRGRPPHAQELAVARSLRRIRSRDPRAREPEARPSRPASWRSTSPTSPAAELRGRTAQVTLRFVSQLISVTRDKAGNVIEGNPEKVTEVTDVWTFARDISSRDPNWKLVATEAGQ